MPVRPFIPIPHGLRATLRATSTNQAMSAGEMTFGFISAATLPSLADCIAVWNMLANQFTTNWLGTWASDILTTQLIVESVAEEEGPEYPFPLNLAGSGSTGTHGVYAPISSLRTANRGRSVTGRSYNFMPPDTAILTTQFDNSYISTLNSAYLDLIVAAEAAGYKYAVLSETIQRGTEIVSALSFAHFAYQKRRDPQRD